MHYLYDGRSLLCGIDYCYPVSILAYPLEYGWIWIPHTDRPRCSNRKCRSTRFLELSLSELNRYIEDLTAIRDSYLATLEEEEKVLFLIEDEDEDCERLWAVT